MERCAKERKKEIERHHQIDVRVKADTLFLPFLFTICTKDCLQTNKDNDLKIAVEIIISRNSEGERERKEHIFQTKTKAGTDLESIHPTGRKKYGF